MLLVAAVCVRLGLWQLDRREQRREINEAQRAALALPPLELTGDTLAAVARDPSAYRYRRASVRGVPLPEAEVVVRGRSRGGRPGVHLATPLRVERSGAAVLVNRGWAPAPDAATLDPRPLAEPGLREIQGIILPLPPPGSPARPLETDVAGVRILSVQRLTLREIQPRLPVPLLPFLLQQLPSAGDPELPARLPLPDLDDPGPHLSYALQWFGFATIAVVGFAVLVRRHARAAR